MKKNDNQKVAANVTDELNVGEKIHQQFSGIYWKGPREEGDSLPQSTDAHTDDMTSEESPGEYLAIGCDLVHLPHMEQLEICQYVASQVDDFAESACEGYLGSVDIMSGYLQITVQCESPDQALTDFLSKLTSGEIEIPENNDEAPVFQYAVIGEGDPILFMIYMIDEVNGEDCICDDCLKAMQEAEATSTKMH